MSEDAIEAAVRAEICRLADFQMVEVQNDSDLFELGFDSMMVIRLMAQLKAVFDVEITAGDLFIAPTACAISDLIRKKLADGNRN